MRTRILTLVLALAALSARAELTIQWKDKFDDNAQQWPIGEDTAVILDIKEGWYRLTSKSEAGGIGVRALAIDRTKDYSIAALLRHDGANGAASYGILWDCKDGENFYALLLSPGGAFSVFRVAGGKSSALVPWKQSSVVKPQQGPNLVSVTKTGNNLELGVNGQTIATLPYETVNGPYIGFIVIGTEALAADWISFAREGVYTGELIEPAAGSEIFSRDSFFRTDAPWLVGKSGDIEGSYDGNISPPSRRYLLVHSTRGTIDVVTRDFGFDPTRDFSIEASLRKMEGDDNVGYGLVLDRKGRDYLLFSVAGTGHYGIWRYSSGTRTEIVKWTPSQNVNPYENVNRIGVFRTGPKLVYAVNGRKVFEQDYTAWGSTEVGFSLSGIMKVRPEELVIRRVLPSKGAILGDCVKGFGLYAFDDGSRYVGSWKGGKPDGLGTKYHADGRMEEGLWERGVLKTSTPPEEGPLFYPVSTKTDSRGFVDSKGANKSFKISYVVHVNRPIRGFPLVAVDKLIGFVDASGKTRSDPSWSLTTGFVEGLALISPVAAGRVDQGPYFGIIDSSGKVVVPPGKTYINWSATSDHGLIPFQEFADGGEYGLMGRDATVIVPPELGDMWPFREGLAVARPWVDGPFGFIDRTGAWRIKPELNDASSFSEGLAYFATSKAVGFMDRDGRVAFTYPIEYLSNENVGQYRSSFKEGLLPIFDYNQRGGYLDKQGKVAIAPTYTKTRDFSEGLAAVNLGGKPNGAASIELIGGWGFINTKGEVVIPLNLELAASFSNGLAAVRAEGKWGYIDKKGQWVIQPAFEEAYPFRPEGLAQVKVDGYYTWIDRTGKAIWTP